MASLHLFSLCSALFQSLRANSNAMAPHDIEALAAHENSPLLGRDDKKYGTHKSSNSSRSTSSTSISSDNESATTADSVNYDVESQTLAKEPPAQQKLVAMLCLLLIGKPFSLQHRIRHRSSVPNPHLPHFQTHSTVRLTRRQPRATSTNAAYQEHSYPPPTNPSSQQPTP